MATVTEMLTLRTVTETERDRAPSRVIATTTMDQATPTHREWVRTGQGAQRIIIMEGKSSKKIRQKGPAKIYFSFMYTHALHVLYNSMTHGEHGHAHHGPEGGGAGDGSGNGNGEGSRRYCPCCYCELFGHNGVRKG